MSSEDIQGDASVGSVDESIAGVDTPEDEAPVDHSDDPSSSDKMGTQPDSHADDGGDGTEVTKTSDLPPTLSSPPSLLVKEPDGNKKTTPDKGKVQFPGSSSSLKMDKMDGGIGRSTAGSRARSASSGAANNLGLSSSNPYLELAELAGLEGMDEEAVLQALYDNPELAAAAREVAAASTEEERAARRERMRLREEAKAKESGGDERYYRMPDGSIKKVGAKPDYVEILKEEGVPVKSWLVIAALFGVGLYQLRKSLKAPSVDTKAKVKREKGAFSEKVSLVKKRSGGKQKGKKSGAGKSKPSGGGKKVAETSNDVETKEETPKEMKSEDADAAEGFPQEAEPKKKPPKKKKAKKHVVTKDKKVQNGIASSQSKEGSSTSATVVPEQPLEKEADESGPETILHNYDEEDRRAIMQVLNEGDVGNDEGDWQMAGRKSKKKQLQRNGDVATKASPESGVAAKDDTRVEPLEPKGESAGDASDVKTKPASSGTVPPTDSGGVAVTPTDTGGVAAATNVSEQINATSADTKSNKTKPVQAVPKSTENAETTPKVEEEAETKAAADVQKGKSVKEEVQKKNAKKLNGKKEKPEATESKLSETSLSDMETSPKPSSPPTQSTHDDAALARMLQMQEESMVAQDAAKDAEDSWEEVTSKKKKKAAAAAATASAAIETM